MMTTQLDKPANHNGDQKIAEKETNRPARRKTKREAALNGAPVSVPSIDILPIPGDITANELGTQDVVKFTLADQWYGLPIRNVVEVLPMVAFTVLPTMPTGMRGVINFRGQVIPLIDLKQVVTGQFQQVRLSTPIIVGQYQDRMMGLMVEDVEDVAPLAINTNLVTDALSTDVTYIGAISYSESELILILDLCEIYRLFPHLAASMPPALSQ